MENRDTSRLFRDEQGTWHWVYRLHMFKNLSMLRTVLKAIGICYLAIAVIMIALLHSSGAGAGGMKMMITVLVLVGVAVLGISVGSYYLVAWFYGGDYVAVYTMDEQSIAQYQPADQADKGKAIGLLSAVAGTISGNAGLIVTGFLAGARLVVRTEFTKIRSLKVLRSLGEIRVHAFLTWYTVYVNPEDFDLVAEHITSRSVNARITS